MIDQATKNLRSVIILLMAALFLTNIFLKLEWIDNVISVLVFMLLCLSILAIRGVSLVIGSLLLSMGTMLLLYNHAQFETWISSVNRNDYLIVMFTLVPLLRIPIRVGGYMVQLEAFFFRYVLRKSQFYLFINVLAFLVAPMVNVAGLPLLYQIGSASEYSEDQRLLSTAINRGVAAGATWAPSYASIALVTELIAVRYQDFYLYGLLLGSLAIILGWVILLIKEKQANHIPKLKLEEQYLETINWKKILELIALVIVLMGTITFFSLKSQISVVIIVSFVSIFFSIIWLTIIKKLAAFPREFWRQYFAEDSSSLKNEVVLFLGAGFFASAFNYADLGEIITRLFSSLIGNNNLLFSVILCIFIIILSTLGLHPIIAVTIIGSNVQPANYNVSPAFMALVLTSGWSLGSMLSPSSAINIFMADLVKKTPVDVGLKWNVIYVALLFIIQILTMNLLRGFGLL